MGAPAATIALNHNDIVIVLPDELFAEVLLHLPLRALLHVAPFVCRRWCVACSAQTVLSHDYYTRRDRSCSKHDNRRGGNGIVMQVWFFTRLS